MVTAEERCRLATILRGLETLETPVEDALANLWPLAGVDVWMTYSISEHVDGWRVSRCVTPGQPRTRIADRFIAVFERRTDPGLFFDAVRPERAQRNRLIEATSSRERRDPGSWRRTPVYLEAMAPVGLGDHEQHRILLCEGASLLAWFGAFHDRALTAGQRRILLAIAAALRKRLLVERRLEGAPRALATLDAALEHIATAAFIVDEGGAICVANREARRALSGGCKDIRAALHDALAGRPSSIAFDLTPLREPGTRRHHLAIARPPTDQRLAIAVAHAQRRWALTPRQREVLARVLAGATNAAIAADLRVSARAIESHVTALLDRSGVDSRAALAAVVLAR